MAGYEYCSANSILNECYLQTTWSNLKKTKTKTNERNHRIADQMKWNGMVWLRDRMIWSWRKNESSTFEWMESKWKWNWKTPAPGTQSQMYLSFLWSLFFFFYHICIALNCLRARAASQKLQFMCTRNKEIYCSSNANFIELFTSSAIRPANRFIRFIGENGIMHYGSNGFLHFVITAIIACQPIAAGLYVCFRPIWKAIVMRSWAKEKESNKPHLDRYENQIEPNQAEPSHNVNSMHFSMETLNFRI